MKYLISATPGPMPPTPEQFDAAMDWLEGKADDGTFDCIFGFVEGGGFSITNADSHREVLDLMADYTLCLDLSPGRCAHFWSSRRESTRCGRSWPRPRRQWLAARRRDSHQEVCDEPGVS
jgi:hypothetical protein